MADKPESTPGLCGRLWATLVVLCGVGEDRGKNRNLDSVEYLDKAQRRPEEHLEKQLALAATYLRKACRRSAQHRKVATELFLAIPELIPLNGQFPPVLDDASRSIEFRKAYHEQRSRYAQHEPLFR